MKPAPALTIGTQAAMVTPIGFEPITCPLGARRLNKNSKQNQTIEKYIQDLFRANSFDFVPFRSISFRTLAELRDLGQRIFLKIWMQVQVVFFNRLIRRAEILSSEHRIAATRYV